MTVPAKRGVDAVMPRTSTRKLTSSYDLRGEGARRALRQAGVVGEEARDSAA